MINLAYPHNAYHQFVREDDMEGMLRDAFNMCNHGLQSFPPEIIASDDCDIGGNVFTKMGRSVLDEEPNGEAVKFFKLFMSSKIAESIRWHHDQRTGDGLLRHPADSLAWKSFDSKFPSFASDPQNVRLGLASDGFNPFKIISTSYSTWPVMLVPYNFPMWICMK
ncbi:hypothetical protein CXB51_034871 [Gossypium anomalum]|uniref:Uncharacterized protein n=1 Tax=Gossypium anomalum TaxID=47600 RepID=A0A8J6CJB1_9ROSI|nr:hypothetical protein CXB51_034871 [Gossypium anomalum]